MRTLSVRSVRSLAFLALLQGACHGDTDDGDGGDADSDSPRLRHAAMYEWYNEAPPPTVDAPLWSRQYNKFVLDAARTEHGRWSTLLPHPNRILNLVSGTEWTNLGPTRANVLKNGAT